MSDNRVLFISPMDMTVNNGMMQRQHQWLKTLCTTFPGRVDFLSLGDSTSNARAWLLANELDIKVLECPFSIAAYLNSMAWYYGGVFFCNKLRWTNHFKFISHTPMPISWLKRYSKFICYYAWGYHLLCLHRAGDRVLVDLGDIMADRHERMGTRRWISLAREDECSVIYGPAHCVAISANDAKEFSILYGANLPVVPFVPPNSDSLLNVSKAKERRSIGFVGAPSYLNEEILKLLACDKFLKKLREAGITLTVAGGICHSAKPSILKRLRAGGATVMGNVKDINDFYNSSAVILNPVGPSSGIKIKSVEALIADRILVTTRWGSDPSLEEAFPEQIYIIDWPVTQSTLITACIESIEKSITKKTSYKYAYTKYGKAIMLEKLLT